MINHSNKFVCITYNVHNDNRGAIYILYIHFYFNSCLLPATALVFFVATVLIYTRDVIQRTISIFMYMEHEIQILS